MNRGIWMEGIGTVVAGLLGTGSGTTSYSQNVGAIGVTKVIKTFVLSINDHKVIIF